MVSFRIFDLSFSDFSHVDDDCSQVGTTLAVFRETDDIIATLARRTVCILTLRPRLRIWRLAKGLFSPSE